MMNRDAMLSRRKEKVVIEFLIAENVNSVNIHRCLQVIYSNETIVRRKQCRTFCRPKNEHRNIKEIEKTCI